MPKLLIYKEESSDERDESCVFWSEGDNFWLRTTWLITSVSSFSGIVISGRIQLERRGVVITTPLHWTTIPDPALCPRRRLNWTAV